MGKCVLVLRICHNVNRWNIMVIVANLKALLTLILMLLTYLSSANKCLQKVAWLSVQHAHQYERAFTIYEKVCPVIIFVYWSILTVNSYLFDFAAFHSVVVSLLFVIDSFTTIYLIYYHGYHMISRILWISKL